MKIFYILVFKQINNEMIENPKALEILIKPVLGIAGFKKSICSENQIERGRLEKHGSILSDKEQ